MTGKTRAQLHHFQTAMASVERRHLDALERIENLTECLLAATAYVELSTPNGVTVQPPAWALRADGQIDAQEIALCCRRTLNAYGVS